MLRLSGDFLKLVEDLKDDVFKPSGLPSLLIKDQIRETKLKLRFFATSTLEDQN